MTSIPHTPACPTRPWPARCSACRVAAICGPAPVLPDGDTAYVVLGEGGERRTVYVPARIAALYEREMARLPWVANRPADPVGLFATPDGPARVTREDGTMPPIIAFAWTTPCLQAGRKTCTRRSWTPDYARRFKAGDELLAYNRSPRQKGVPIARIRLTAAPSWESTKDAPDEDYEAEGFAHLAEHPELTPKGDRPWTPALYDEWRAAGVWQWVIRFAVVELYDAAEPQHPRASVPVARAKATGQATLF